MQKKRILFISGSIGLGHAGRDVAISTAIRKLNPAIEIGWLAGEPARRVIAEAGEVLMPESRAFGNETDIAEEVAEGFSLNLAKYAWRARHHWAQNVATFKQVLSKNRFDLVVADESYEIAAAIRKQPELKNAPFVMIYDFVGLDRAGRNPWERLLVHLVNRTWSGGSAGRPPSEDLVLMIGEPEDVPDRPFGFLLPNRRDYAMRHYEFVGYVLGFDPGSWTDRVRIRAALGYDDRPLIICSIGGTAVGRDLLELCGEAYPHMQELAGDVQMVMVCGGRLDPSRIRAPKGVRVRGYVPRLFEHLGACDLAIVHGGGTTTLELTALGRPFVYFPLEGHAEQEAMVAYRLARHRAGERRRFTDTSPRDLAETAVGLLSEEVRPQIPADGARRAAVLINRLL